MNELTKRLQNINVFQDTQRLNSSIPELIDAIEYSIENQEFIPEDGKVIFEDVQNARYHMQVKVSGRSTLEAARQYSQKRVCILNFANAEIPGGGVKWGMPTQEESICRCSTLYDCISVKSMREQFYKPHWLMGALHNDDIIYTPEVVVYKTDTRKPKVMKYESWYKVDVITCVAPDLNSPIKKVKISEKELSVLHYKRALRILEVARAKGNEVVILGAFGCGDFKNPPEVVAKAFRRALEEYRNKFQVVEFAIFDPEKKGRNYLSFTQIIEGL